MDKYRFIKNAMRSTTALVIMTMLLFALVANAIVIPLIPAAPVYAVTETFNTAGTFTWTAPAGVTSVTVEVWGGGGHSGLGWGGGGGGGAYSKKANIAVTPGNSYAYVVGAGATTTAPGGDSYFIDTSTLLAKGGSSSQDYNKAGAAGGAATSGVGDIRWSGGNGADSKNTGNPKWGGGGGSSAGTDGDGNSATDWNGATAPTGGGDGGDGGTSKNMIGADGLAPGGGGGGGYQSSGGDGADGQVRITYKYDTTTIVASSLNPSTYGQSVTFTATVSNPGATGTVQFYIDGSPFGDPKSLSGGIATSDATSSLSVDNHPVTADYSGDADFNPSTGTLTGGQTVNPAPTSIDITAPDDISDWDLDPTLGENTYSGTLAVDVTPSVSTGWSVTAKDMDAATGGYMTEWSGSAYGTAKLENPMHVQGPAAEVTLPNTAGIDIAAGTGDYLSIDIDFKQTVTWDDAIGTYQIVVTFIGTLN